MFWHKVANDRAVPLEYEKGKCASISGKKGKA